MVRSVFGDRGDGTSMTSLGLLAKDSSIEKSVHLGSVQNDHCQRLWLRGDTGGTMPNRGTCTLSDVHQVWVENVLDSEHAEFKVSETSRQGCSAAGGC